MSLASRDNTPSRGVIPQTSSTTIGEYYYNSLIILLFYPERELLSYSLVLALHTNSIAGIIWLLLLITLIICIFHIFRLAKFFRVGKSKMIDEEKIQLMVVDHKLKNYWFSIRRSYLPCTKIVLR